jgi:hypothetical protein
VGSASTRYLGLVQGLGLDVYQAHWYDHFEAVAPLAKRPSLDRPLILGEFPTKGSKKDVATILDTARKAGYVGAMPWSVGATDDATDFATAEAPLAAWGRDHTLAP